MDDLDKITYGEYKKRNNVKVKSTSLHTKTGLGRETLVNMINIADKSGVKMFVWVQCLQSYVRVYRNSIMDSLIKCKSPEKLSVRKEYKELYFK
jgi:hypothetical protein